jgi:hypothetical protein
VISFDSINETDSTPIGVISGLPNIKSASAPLGVISFDFINKTASTPLGVISLDFPPLKQLAHHSV